MSDDEDFSNNFAKRIIYAKISNQIVILRRYSRNSDNDVSDEIKMMKICTQKLDNAHTSEEIMGFEGTAAKYYFSALSKLVNNDFSFNCRSRMPPKDPFNSMLSLGYTLLMYEIYGEIENKGLSPYAGFLHKDRERHPTLASEFIEKEGVIII